MYVFCYKELTGPSFIFPDINLWFFWPKTSIFLQSILINVFFIHLHGQPGKGLIIYHLSGAVIIWQVHIKSWYFHFIIINIVYSNHYIIIMNGPHIPWPVHHIFLILSRHWRPFFLIASSSHVWEPWQRVFPSVWSSTLSALCLAGLIALHI